VFQLGALGSRKGACGFPRFILVHLPGDRGAAAIVIPVKILAGPAIGEPDFKAAGVWNAPERMWDDANAIDHDPFALSSTLVWRITIKFNVRAMNPSRLPVSVKDHLDRHAPDRGFRNAENHACLNFGSRCARFSELAQSNAVAHTELRGGSPCSVRQAQCQNNPFEVPATRLPDRTSSQLTSKGNSSEMGFHQSALLPSVLRPAAADLIRCFHHSAPRLRQHQAIIISSNESEGLQTRPNGSRDLRRLRSEGYLAKRHPFLADQAVF